MKKIFLTLAAIALLLLSSCNAGKDTRHLPKAEDFGRMDEAVTAYLQDIRHFTGSTTVELNSVMVLQHGKKLLEWYDNCYGPDFRNICWSASKTFTSAAVGFAVQEGLLSLDDCLVDYLKKEQLPDQVSDTLAGLTLRNLIIMSSGLSKDAIADLGSYCPDCTIKSILSRGFAFEPGSRYRYNSFNTYLLSAVITNITGQRLSEYLKPRLFEPLGIRNYYWDLSLEGYDMGGWGLYLTTEGLAKMGQLYLQKGLWDGKQLLASQWIEESMTAHIFQSGTKVPGDDHASGYGYQMWVNAVGGGARLDGAHGQWVIICPDKDAVIVITQNTNARKSISFVWKEFYDRI